MKKYFKNKRVLIIGNTGFKGSWLTFWMQYYEAKVLGISLNIPTNPSNFKILNLEKKNRYKKIDIRNFNKLKKQILDFKPDFIFHLAAEAIVKKAYKNPKYTWETNTIGTINVLECISKLKKNIIAVVITSDKVYKNLEIKRGYKENDELGGVDPYSASKSAADIAIQSYYFSQLQQKKNIKICIARAGNVIGGGDWSEGRLIPDCIKKWSKNEIVSIRNPNSTRPWQHVLDVLSGYITLAIKIKQSPSLNGEVFNFGPNVEKKRKVINVVKEINKSWKNAKWKIKKSKNFKESNLLQLNSSKAKKLLNWNCKLNLKKAIAWTTNWYKKYYFSRKEIKRYSLKQITDYENLKK